MTPVDRGKSFHLTDISKATCYLIDGPGNSPGSMRNLSAGGRFLEVQARPEVSKMFEIHIVVKGKSSRLVADSPGGTVTSREADGVALRFAGAFLWLALVPIFYQ